MNAIYEEAKTTATKIRKALKKEFPGAKFSVKSSTYSMGSSVSVRWEDGPSHEAVQAVCDIFQSCSFDGYQDMKVSTGYIDPVDGLLYSGADYIQASRNFSSVYREQLEAIANTMFRDFSQQDYQYHWRMKMAEEELKAVAAV